MKPTKISDSGYDKKNREGIQSNLVRPFKFEIEELRPNLENQKA